MSKKRQTFSKSGKDRRNQNNYKYRATERFLTRVVPSQFIHAGEVSDSKIKRELSKFYKESYNEKYSTPSQRNAFYRNVRRKVKEIRDLKDRDFSATKRTRNKSSAIRLIDKGIVSELKKIDRNELLFEPNANKIRIGKEEPYFRATDGGLGTKLANAMKGKGLGKNFNIKKTRIIDDNTGEEFVFRKGEELQMKIKLRLVAARGRKIDADEFKQAEKEGKKSKRYLNFVYEGEIGNNESVIRFYIKKS